MSELVNEYKKSKHQNSGQNSNKCVQFLNFSHNFFGKCSCLFITFDYSVKSVNLPCRGKRIDGAKNDLGNAEERNPLIEKRRYGYLIRRVKHCGYSSALTYG